MSVFNGICGRLKRLEEFRKRVNLAQKVAIDEDGFVSALVGSEKDKFRLDNGGFDVIAALNDTAAADWKDYSD